MPVAGEERARVSALCAAIRSCRKSSCTWTTIYEYGEIDMSFVFFGKKFAAPFFVAPLAGSQNQYGPKYQSVEFGRTLLRSTSQEGGLTFLPDGPGKMFEETCSLCEAFPGNAVPTIKPWPIDVMLEKFKRSQQAGAFAVCTDLDGAGLALVQGGAVPVMPHTVKELSKLCASVTLPVIVKGVMTPAGAKKCLEAGVSAIVVSNHGGRVLEQAPAPVEMLSAIVDAVGRKMEILIDGAIRTGADLFKIRGPGRHGGAHWPPVCRGGLRGRQRRRELLLQQAQI